MFNAYRQKAERINQRRKITPVEFSEVFDEHRQMRYLLLALIEAFQAKDSEKIRQGIEERRSIEESDRERPFGYARGQWKVLWKL